MGKVINLSIGFVAVKPLHLIFAYSIVSHP